MTGPIIAIILIASILIILLIFFYAEMLNPLSKLKKATKEIRDGNLDYELKICGRGDVRELCVDFEEMRKRLKDVAEEKLQVDRENKILISNISHDLKTPITSIKGYAEGIIAGVANNPEKLDKYVRTIYNKANDMNSLIDELTLYSRIDTNKIPYNFERVKASSYFAAYADAIRMDLESQNFELTYYNYMEKDACILADDEQIRRVMNNIVGNSVKYNDKRQGIINIRVRDAKDMVQVEFEDNGPGIAKSDLPYVFDRFYRADASRKSAGGSGIGLSIVKKIIEDHGGRIWVTSEEGTGTVFYFVLQKYQEAKV